MDETDFATYLKAIDRLNDHEGVLGDEFVIHPPESEYGYDSTPKNAIVFGCMGADGVHYAVLTRNGTVRNDSPVIQICPMDFDDLYQVKAATFLSFLADACGVPAADMEAVFAAERAGQPALVEFLKSRFNMSRLWDDERTKALAEYLAWIEPKT